MTTIRAAGRSNTMNQTCYNFNAGPSALPEQVRSQTIEAIRNFRNTGIGILETSHRSSAYEQLLEETRVLLRNLLGIPSDYDTIFCTGGATQQFSMVPLNILDANEQGAYLLTGVWAEKAYEEAVRLRRAFIAASSADTDYSSIPQVVSEISTARYLHYTSNNTIFGTQFHQAPESGKVPLVVDASSDFCSAPIDFSRHALVYAGAQKNVGTSGITVVIAQRDILEAAPADTPVLLQYASHYNAKSLYNTPPTLAQFVLHAMLSWINDRGGVSAMHERARKRASEVYAILDSYPVFHPFADLKDRSYTNITFQLRTAELTKEFLAKAQEAGFVGLNGHRSIGGVRVSLYNGTDDESVRALHELLHTWGKKYR